MRTSVPKSDQQALPILLVIFAVASLAHFTPLSAHSAGMNATILTEVTAAGCVPFEVVRQVARHVFVRVGR